MGSVEDRPWGPAALDCVLASEVACRAAERCGVLAAPPLCYGLWDETHSWGLYAEPGVLRALLESIAGWASRLGSRLVVLNAHVGNRVLEGLTRVEWIDVWRLLEGEGVAGWEEQVRLEKMIARGEAGELLDRVAGRVCEMLQATV